MTDVVLDRPLSWQEVVAVADGAALTLSEGAQGRIAGARAIVEAIVARGIRAYGVNTGVGALCDVIVDTAHQRTLSRNLLMSHACGIGAPLGARETRAIMAAAINNYAHGHSGVRPEVVEALVALVAGGVVPEVPARGSVGYLTHMAHIALVLIGEGRARIGDETMTGAEALARIGRAPLVLEAKEGLSLVNGTPCGSGLGAVALARAARFVAWADAAAALTFEALGGQIAAFDPESLALLRSPGIRETGDALRRLLDGSPALAASAGRRTQDALSLRAVPQVHGAARDVFETTGHTLDRELASVTDNPAVAGTPEEPKVFSEAHAVSASLGLSLDSLGVAVAEIAAMSERRLDRLVNPLVSGLPAFLAEDGGASSGFMIAQYAALALVGENRRLAAPASLDAGVTSALQEDHLVHSTPAALKALTILDNAEQILAIELLAAAQASEIAGFGGARGTESVYDRVRAVIGPYRDDRPLADDLARAAALIRGTLAPRG